MQYEREFPEDETGGKSLDFRAEDCEEQIKNIFGNDGRVKGHVLIRDSQVSTFFPADVGCRYQPIVIEDDGDSEFDSEDATLTALLHERVIKVKQEIDWDLEEQKSREKRRKKELMLMEGYSSSDDESDSAVYPGVRWRRRNGRGKWAWPTTNSFLSIETSSDPKNYVQEGGGDPLQLVVIDPCSQAIATITLQPGLESEDNPNDQDETIFYSQDNSVTLYPDQSQSLSQSILDYTDMCTTDSEGTDSAVSGVPFDIMPVRSHHRFQNNRSALHRTNARNEVVLPGSPPTCDNRHRYRTESEFLSSVNSETEVDLSSKPSVYIPTLDVYIPDYRDPTHTSPDNTTANLQSCDPRPSSSRHRPPTGVKPFNIVDVIKIDSQSSTEQDEILSGTASETDDPRHFSARQPISRGHPSLAVARVARWDGNSETTGTSQTESESESELEIYRRQSRARLALARDNEADEESLLSGYESGYMEPRTRTSTRLSTIVSSCSPSLSSTPPPSDDAMTPPSSPERSRQEKGAATSKLTAVKLKSLQLSITPVCIIPRRESLSELLTCTSANPPLPPSRTPLSEARAHVAELEGGVADKDISKKVSAGVAQDCDGASLNPNPSTSAPAPTSDATTREEDIPRLKRSDTTAKDRDTPQQSPTTTSSAHLIPSTEPLPSNRCRNETSDLESAQDNPSELEREDTIANCATCYSPWRSTKSVMCAHCPAPGCSLLCLSPPCSCLHTCTYDHHNIMHSQQHPDPGPCHNRLQVMSQEGAQNSSNHTLAPPNGKNNSTDVTCSTTGGSYGDSRHTLPTGSSNSSEANPPSVSLPSPSREPNHGGSHTQSASSCRTCTHGSNTNCCSLLPSPSHTPHVHVLPSSSSTQEESHICPTSPCSSHHTLTSPHSYTNHSNLCPCSSTVQQSSPPRGLFSRLYAMPSPQLMPPLNSLKRSREGEELSSNSSENEISSPPTKRPCL